MLGAGVMGSGIAQVTATAGYDTVCYDVDAGALDAAREHVTTGRFGLDRGVERGKLTRDDADAALARLRFTDSFDDAAATDLVIEAVPERLELKIRVFRDLDAVAPARHDPRVEHVGLPDRRARRRHRPARPGDRLALGVPAPGHEAGRDRAHRETSDETVVDTVARVATRVRQEPGRRERHPDELGLRREPRRTSR